MVAILIFCSPDPMLLHSEFDNQSTESADGDDSLEFYKPLELIIFIVHFSYLITSFQSKKSFLVFSGTRLYNLPKAADLVSFTGVFIFIHRYCTQYN